MRLPLPILVLLAALASVPARADDLANAQRLWLAGQKTQAVEQVEQALTRAPDDLQLRFALGVMRMEQGERAKASSIFTRLTQDFPDLADPFAGIAIEANSWAHHATKADHDADCIRYNALVTHGWVVLRFT